MTTTTLDKYLHAWSLHCDGQDASLQGMLDNSSPEVVYADINLPQPFRGHAGIRQVCAGASANFPGTLMTVKKRVVEGALWSIQWEMTGQKGGASFTVQGASWGSLGADGKVDSQTDFWNPAHLAARKPA